MYKLFQKCNSILRLFSESLFRQGCVSSQVSGLFSDMWLHHNHRHCTLFTCSSHFLCVCASFEMNLIWIFMAVLFSCHDSHKHLHEMSGIGLWICCLMGGNYHMFEHMDGFHFDIYDVGCLLYCMCFWARQRDMQLYLRCLLQFVGRPTGGVCINAVICNWHALETSILSRSTASDIDQCKSYRLICVAAFSCTVAEKAAQERYTHSIYCSVERYGLRVMCIPWSSQCSLSKCPSSVTNLNNFSSSNFFFFCHCYIQ